MGVASRAAPLLAGVALAVLAGAASRADAPATELPDAAAGNSLVVVPGGSEPDLRPALAETASAEAPPLDDSEGAPSPPATDPSGPALTGAIVPKPADVYPVLPEPPAADVVITAAETLSAAISARLEDPRRALSLRLPKKERDALAAFYAGEGHRPIWIADGSWTPAARAVVARLAEAREDGLNPTDYPMPALPGGTDTAAELADAEVRLSAMAVLYARDARGARLDPSRISPLITPKLDIPGAGAVLTKLRASGEEAGAALQSYNPQQAGYRALKAKLSQIRAPRPVATTEPVAVPYGPMLKVGMHDPRVPLVRARFGLGPAEDDTVYDERLASAVTAFQREKGLVPSGVLTRQTVAALTPRPMGRPVGSEADIIANMERWRWMPADLGERYVMVNIPEFRVRVVQDGRVTHETRAIVGKPDTPTPLFSASMEYAIVNPSWNVPPSILKNEFLPKLAKDPLYAARLGYEIVRHGNSIAIRQPPGERNALGHIKFMFPNQHAVYLHDTPNRSLFSASRRAFSHGCVRVDQPMELAEVLLGGRWSAERVESLVGHGERTINLSRPLPVHIGYFTTFVDETGALRSAEDVYGYNRKVRAALNLDG